MRSTHPFTAAAMTALLVAACAGLPACGGSPEGVAKTFEDMQGTLSSVNEDPNRAAVSQLLDDCARDARDGKVSMMESVMFRNELKACAKDGMIGDEDLAHLRAQHETMIKE